MIYNPYKANLIRNTPRVFYRIHNIEETSNLLNITISSIQTIVDEESYVNFNKDLSDYGY
jgi:regulator of sigma D